MEYRLRKTLYYATHEISEEDVAMVVKVKTDIPLLSLCK